MAHLIQTIKQIQSNLTNFTKIVINDFGGAFLSRNRSSEVFGQFDNIPNLSFAGNARADGPHILTGTSLRNCFSFCDNFNENLNNWGFSEVVNMRSMFYSLPWNSSKFYKFDKSSVNPEFGYLSINTENNTTVNTVTPSSTYIIKVRQPTDDNDLITFSFLDYFTSQNRLDLLTIGGSVIFYSKMFNLGLTYKM